MYWKYVSNRQHWRMGKPFMNLSLAGLLVSRFVAAGPQDLEGHCVCKIRVRDACSAFPGIDEVGWFDDASKGGPKLSCCESRVCRQRANGWAADCRVPVEHSFVSEMGGKLSSPLYYPRVTSEPSNDAALQRLELDKSKNNAALQKFASRCGADIACDRALAILKDQSAKVHIPTAFPALLEFGGFTCYAFIKLLTGSTLIRGVSDDANIRALWHLCGSAKRPSAPSAPSTVVLQHHNGLGNQLFQNLFGELLARDIGYRLARTTDTLIPVCHKETKDPNTDLGFHVFRQLMGENGSPPVPHYRDVCQHHISISFEKLPIEHAILAETHRKDCEGSLCYARHRGEIHHILVRDLIEYITSDDIAGPRCVFLVGYFQDLAMYGNASATQDVLSEFTFTHPTPPVGVDQAAQRRQSAAQTVVHFRGEPKEIEPFKRFYRKYLESLNGSVEIVAAAGKQKEDSKLITFLVDTFGARMYPGVNLNGAANSLIDDFRVMVFADNFVPFPHSTLSFWACVFSLSQRVDHEDEHPTATLPSPFLLQCWLRSRI